MHNFTSKFSKNLINVFGVPPAQRSQHDLEEIMKLTKDIKFLKSISEQRNSDRIHWECCRVMTLEIYNPEEPVINFGEVGDKFYIIIKGKVGIYVPSKTRKKGFLSSPIASRNTQRPSALIIPPVGHELQAQLDIQKSPFLIRRPSVIDMEFLESIGQIEEFKEIRTLYDGDSFGELALLSNKPRSATVKCKEVSYFAILTQKDYKRILRTDAEKSIHDRVEFLKGLPIFALTNHTTLKNLAYMMTENTFRKNQVLYSEGSPAEYIYFIKSGEFKLTVKEDIEVPSIFNESSLLKLKHLRKKNRKVDFQMVIKGKGEMFGQEELVDDHNKRNRICTCVSTFGQVYMAHINDVKNRPACQMIINSIRQRYEIETERNTDRLVSLRTIENLKHNFSKKDRQDISGDIQNYLSKMSQRPNPPIIVSPHHDYKTENILESKRKKLHSRLRLASDSGLCIEITKNVRMSASQASLKSSAKDHMFSNSSMVKNILKKSGISGLFKENCREIVESPLRPEIHHCRNKSYRATLITLQAD
ncbi:hypothetical protein SteCoe_13639 [Stentor coeruleus]|uniref:Cyclic nucleotide-binding domain-containing protein n=1 Tax=Stentor coeruleus TaxID=5963 RepID=A0A1R2C7X2_9CILI|nr:hypothetical protein SteCoe_13639 [Stentor coeruleus]